MATITGMSEREWQALLDREGRSCACDDRGGVCLAHYGVMDNGSSGRVRRALGIRDFEGRRY